MSRSSSRSTLAPSTTGSSGGVDMGSKTQPSVSTGGIGVTQEVGSIGGVSVTAGVGVEILPLGIDISGDPNYEDPSKSTVSVSASAEIPGGLLGFGAGVTVNTSTGEVVGGSIGGEVLGLGVNVSNSPDGFGLGITLQIPFTPIELELGFGFPTEKNTKPTPTPEKPKPSPQVGTRVSAEGLEGCQAIARQVAAVSSGIAYPIDPNNGDAYPIGKGAYWETTLNINDVYPIVGTGSTSINGGKIYHAFQEKIIHQISYFHGNGWRGSAPQYNYQQYRRNGQGRTEAEANSKTESARWELLTHIETIVIFKCPPNHPADNKINNNISFPNPPPRKRNMDECCRISIKLQRLIIRHLGVMNPDSQENLPEGVNRIGSSQEGLNVAFPFEVRKRWINPTAKENEKTYITNARQLTLVLGGMIERLERTIGTSEFYKDSDKKLRQSEGNMLSWLTGKNNDFKYPDPNDFWLNTDDGIINEKTLEVRSIADGLRYQIEALNRLERILPIAELKDSSIPARWIYPNGQGQLRVGNLIHLCEYMIRKSDKDMGYWPQKITIKAANPAIKDDEAITTDVHSQADILRVILQQILDIEGDGDMGSNYDLRRTYLDVMAFQMLAKNNKYLQAITEYLSFDMTEEVSKIPIPFDPFAGKERSVIEDWWIKYGFGEEKLNFPTKNTESEIEQLSEGLLQNSELEVNTIKFGSLDERKDPKTLKEALIEILKHSSAASAAVTEVASEGALERIVDAASLAQKLTSFLMRRDIRESLGIGDLDNWISSAEKGYADNLETESLRFPESNLLEPYGRPATQNPTIREIDTKNTKAD